MEKSIVPGEVLSSYSGLSGSGEIVPFGGGHINSTFKVSVTGGDYIVQKININVFNRPEEVMSNISQVAECLISKEYHYKILEPLPANDGKTFTVCNGDYWRVFDFIDNTITVEKAKNSEQAYEAAFAFGHFTDSIKEIDCTRLYYTIYDFHNFEKRLIDFKKAVDNGMPERLRKSGEIIEQLLADSHIVSTISSIIKDIPLRPIHSDTKISNILMDAHTNKAVCVIDLDTVMPGHIFYDYGDMVRSFANTTVEDDPNVSDVRLDKDIFEALTRGFVKAVGPSLSDAEWESLLPGAIAVVYVQALRFLADYLIGDVYYKVSYESHNLDRAINQTAYYQAVVRNEDEGLVLLKELKTNK